MAAQERHAVIDWKAVEAKWLKQFGQEDKPNRPDNKSATLLAEMIPLFYFGEAPKRRQ